MAKEPQFDIQKAHKYFSAQCFNNAWGLIDKTDRTKEEDDEMIRLSQTSIWHWTQREDCTKRNLSVGYWQVSRIFALVGKSETARIYGQMSLDYSQGDEPFYVGYAYEALARAESVAGNQTKAKEYIDKARELSETITNSEEKEFLVNDLNTI